MFVALYMPACNHENNPSIAGFATEKCAQDYIYDTMCNHCKYERAIALSGDTQKWKEEHDGWEPSIHPRCACEWRTIPHENFTELELKSILSLQVERETIHKTFR